MANTLLNTIRDAEGGDKTGISVIVTDIVQIEVIGVLGHNGGVFGRHEELAASVMIISGAEGC